MILQDIRTFRTDRQLERESTVVCIKQRTLAKRFFRGWELANFNLRRFATITAALQQHMQIIVDPYNLPNQPTYHVGQNRNTQRNPKTFGGVLTSILLIFPYEGCVDSSQ